ncbi:MAG TPA: SCO family protein [Thermoanaerobaculia bacterium]|jgi:cytochrome oxidase Cu insertion factor (SCO1/SenC/PrrC family)|nr:SCO family protein [Thermoanaerobaculia bacterium]
MFRPFRIVLLLALLLPFRVLAEEPVKPSIPDVSLLDQDGKPVHFYSDLVHGKVVMMSFIFTSCTTVCPPLGATFAKVQKLLGDRDVRLISVSVDPANDTPERLKAWAQKFGGGPGWTLVTGDKDNVTKLLKGLGVYTANAAEHSPLVLIGNDAQNRWTRAYGLAPPAKLVELIDGMAETPKTAESPAQHYFGDIPLVDQDGHTLRLYSDLLKGRTVVIDAMFTSCAGACPLMSDNLAKIQDWLGDRLGKDVYLLSFSVDPGIDTPAKLKEYAARLKARPGWYFLTGTKENVDAALTKLGQHAETREAHSNLFLIGNDKTGLWKKAFGLAKPADLIPIVESVLHDALSP